jgi:competence protein ComEC
MNKFHAIAALSLFLLLFGCTIPFLNPPDNSPPTGNATPIKPNGTPPGRDPDNPYINIILPNTSDNDTPFWPVEPPPITPQGNQSPNATVNRSDKIGSDLKITPTPFSDLELFFMSFGGGDAILIRKGSFTMLLDAGGKDSASDLAEKLRSIGVVRIEVAAISSPTDDNTGGMPSILRSFPVTEYWDNSAPPGNFTNTRLYPDLKAALEQKGYFAKRPQEGDRMTINGMDIEVLNPPPTRSLSSPNIDSLVFKITNNQYCVILMGNSVMGVEDRIIGTGKDLKCDLIKISDHASGFATQDLLITKVRPKIAVVIEGNAAPNPTIIERLRLKGVNATRVAPGAAVRIISDGATPFQISSG